MDQANVSVVMAVRNGAPFIQQAVASVLSQTYRSFQLFIIDDASTDNTWSILGAIARGADVVAVACPLCHTNLDGRQTQMQGRQPIPAMYLTQLMALAFGLFTACVIFSFLAWSRLRLPFAGTIVFLGLSSFGIYLVHSPVMEVTARAHYHLWPALLAQPLLIVLVTAAAGLAVPVLLMQGVRRSPMRWLYPYLFG